MPRFDVSGVGIAACDYVVTLPSFPGPDEKTSAESMTVCGGGTIGTSLVAAARLGMRTAFAGIVGHDEHGRFIIDGLAREGVDVSLVRVRHGLRSPFAFCVATPPRRTVFSVRGPMPSLTLTPAELELLLDTRALHLDTSQGRTAVDLAREARSRGIDVSVDLQRATPEADALLDHADIAVVAASYAREAFPGLQPADAVRRLIRPGMRLAAITLGPEGAVATEGAEPWHVGAASAEVVDSTGAGDAFHGGLLAALLAGHTVARSLEVAARVAALSCAGLGGQTALPRRDELDAFSATGCC